MHSGGEDEEDPVAAAFKNLSGSNACRLQKHVLEIINDDDEERNRASSTDFQAINDEVFRFLSRNDLGFLVEYFTGEYSKTTLQ